MGSQRPTKELAEQRAAEGRAAREEEEGEGCLAKKEPQVLRRRWRRKFLGLAQKKEPPSRVKEEGAARRAKEDADQVSRQEQEMLEKVQRQREEAQRKAKAHADKQAQEIECQLR